MGVCCFEGTLLGGLKETNRTPIFFGERSPILRQIHIDQRVAAISR